MCKQPYLKYLYLDNNNISRIDGLETNKSLRVLSLTANQIQKIENLPNLWLEELNLSANQLTKIEGLETLPVLRSLDLSKNQITKLKGLETIESLKSLNMSLNTISKINQLRYIKNLPLLTDVDFSVNPLQERKYYKLQCLFHMPQLRTIDGVMITSEEKIKAENLHGFDLQSREIIFKTLLPEEKFVDRRIGTIEQVPGESESEGEEVGDSLDQGPLNNEDYQGIRSQNSSSITSTRMNEKLARQYVGELISRVDFDKGGESPRFVQDRPPSMEYTQQ